MNSVITLYKSALINSDRNICIDDGNNKREIDKYLSTLTSQSISNFQYIKHGLSISIKIDSSQIHLQMGVEDFDYNYIKIVNYNKIEEELVEENPIYYFIVGKEWASQNTIILDLRLDTLNSFTYNEDYLISRKSMIIREHKDRYFAGNQYSRNFSFIAPENIESSGYQDYTNYINLTNIYPDMVFNRASGWSVENINVFSSEYDKYLTQEDGDFQGLSISVNPYQTEGGYGIEVVITIETLDAQYDERLILFGFTLKNSVLNTYRLIDKNDESLNVMLYGKELGEIHQELDTSWNLAYKTQQVLSEESNNVVECYLIPDIELNVKSLSSNVINPVSLNNQYVYVIVGGNFNQNNIRIETNDISMLCKYAKEVDTLFVVELYSPDNTNIEAKYYQFSKVANSSSYNIKRFIKSASSTNSYVFKEDTSTNSILILSTASPISSINLENMFPDGQLIFGGYTEEPIYSLETLDRTQATLIKVIKLPYSPSTYSYDEDNNILDISPIWEYDSGTNYLKLVDLNAKFKSTIISQIDNPIASALIHSAPSNPNNPRDIIYESKLFNSNYYLIKFVYDSFTYGFYLENIDIENSIFTSKFRFEFVMTTTINSRFAFLFNDYEYKYEMEDYPKVLNVDRNNEVVIYNSTYLNYIRTGFNYDIKAKNRQNISAGVGITASTIGAIVSAIVGFASSNPVGAVAGVIGAGISLSTGLISGINAISQNENSFAQKQEQMRNQSASASGSNDIDLLEAYSNNRAKLMLYEPSDFIKEKIFDLFYYYGYAINKNGIPNNTSRYWFNYIEADLEFIDSANLPDYVENDLKDRFKKGITFLHYRNNQLDLNQEKENIEMNLL